MSGDLRAVPDDQGVSLRDVVIQLEAVVEAQASALYKVGELLKNLDERLTIVEQLLVDAGIT